MTDSARSQLRQLLLSSYGDLLRRLSKRLGSDDLAGEALQETYLRLECGKPIGPVRSPRAYLFRIAFNIATSLRKANRFYATDNEMDAILDVPDDAPDPAKIVESRFEIEAMKSALDELPERCRRIFFSSWVEGLSHQDIATRFDVSVRTVQKELRLALDHCACRLNRNRKNKFCLPPRKAS